MYVIVGLGNPGLRYAKTRHNLGFMAVDRLSDITGTKVNKMKFKAKVGEGNISGHKVIFVKPQTFMNLSGESVREVMDFYKVSPENLIVIYDDMDIEEGHIRIRPSGSPGTHNGMKSIVNHLGYKDFPRIRIGIGSHGSGDAVGHVIGRIPKNMKSVMQDAIARAADGAIAIIEDGVDKAMNRFNGSN